MKRNTTIALFYTGIAVVCAGIIGTAMWLRRGLEISYQTPVAVNTGKTTVPEWFPIEKDLAAVNQDNQAVKLSDLRGKVWLVAEFFAVCPNCAVRNGTELRKIYDDFKGNPDFHIACVSIDPETDNVEKLGDYARALGAETKNWWFLNAGDAKTTHDYLEHTLKFMGVRNRIDPLDIETNGKYEHDMAFTLVDRNFNVIGKWQLVGAKSAEGMAIDPQLYQKMRGEMFSRIRQELAKTQGVRHLMDSERKQWLARPPREALSKKLGVAAWIATAAVLVLVGLMRRPELHISLPAGVSLSFLPAFHAAVNALAAVALVGALIAVKGGRISLHRKFIFAAMGLSVLFLLSYVAYHFTATEVRYGDADFNGTLDAAERAAVAGSRPIYLLLLISHIVLAGVSLPFILFTFIAGWTNSFAAHRRLARWVFPLWLYVAVTGPVCYWMLRPYYG